MIWPPRIAADLDDGEVSVREYRRDDAAELFTALRDERVWEHIPRAIPRDPEELHAVVSADLGALRRTAFTVRRRADVASAGTAVAGPVDIVVGTTSVFYDPAEPDGVEIGATLLDPAVWGSGVNSRAKRIVVRELFVRGAEWIRLRTDERNVRSAAAILKLGAVDLGVRQDDLVRRDGTVRRSRYFRLDRPMG